MLPMRFTSDLKTCRLKVKDRKWKWKWEEIWGSNIYIR